MAEVTLFFRKFSVFSQRVLIALREKEIPFELVNVDVRNKPQALLDANPIHKKIPTIVHKGKGVAESLVILEYLEDAFPEKVPLLPEDAYAKSQVRFWTDYAYQTISKISAGFRAEPGSPEKLASAEASVSFIKTLNSTLTSFSADGPFALGDKFGYLDVILAPLCSTLGILKSLGGGEIPGPDEVPRFTKWLEAVMARPSVSASIPTAEEEFEFVKARYSQLSETSFSQFSATGFAQLSATKP